MRWLLGNWAFADLGAKIKYKATEAGLPVVEVDPRDTSRTCSTCGHCDKANRKSQSHFLCIRVPSGRMAWIPTRTSMPR
jgi:putative transposase